MSSRSVVCLLYVRPYSPDIFRALKLLTKQPEQPRRPSNPPRPPQNLQNAAARAATALRKILTSDGEDSDESRSRENTLDSIAATEPTLRKGHYCVLFKPQIALHAEEGSDAIVHIAAMGAVVESYALMDPDHIEDPINGQIMRRSVLFLALGLGVDVFLCSQKLQLHGVQAFVPTVLRPDSERCGVPLEILVDFRCESQDYERLIPQTDAVAQYDRFNRLRLHSQFSNASGDLTGTNPENEHLKNQTVSLSLHTFCSH